MARNRPGVSRPLALVLTIAVGLLVGVQPASNAALAEHVGDLGAAFVSLVVATLLVAVVFLIAGHPGRLAGIPMIRPVQLIGALAGAAVVTIGLVAVKPLGAGAVVAVLVAGQLIAAVLADRFGWFGLHHVGIGAGRALGIGLVVAGTVLVTRT
jgi:bacterial/archaeal transporter family-2 protein